ncbi:Pollen receptor-like kinase 3 [Abeliophyllum distichum]|uniref:Pollen receptor-like kinase 3 n=1 Tax=Abeliophyllum distichum TaxID=126358 RepID=A0ABD1Q6X8_9LAMI
MAVMAMAAVRCRLLLLSILIIYTITPSLSVGDDMLLLDFKESLKNSSALDSTWIKGTNPCDSKKPWVGVECNAGKGSFVINLYLHNLGLSGDINIDSLADLHGLRVISFENNKFSGPLPYFNRLTALKSLYLSGNEFSGEIPSDYFAKMGHLKKIELARNKFSGTIPDSLGKLDFLMTLKLEKNDFSGPVPSIAQNSLKEINLSFNKLQGEIPQTMSRFGTNPFEGNPDLCGPIVSKECKPQATTDESQASSGTKWVILTVVVAVLLVTILFKAKHKDDDFDIRGKENLDEVVQVHKRGGSNRRMLSSSRKGSSNSMHSSSRRGGSQHGKSVGDLVVINEEKGIFGLPDLMKAAAEVLGNGGIGSAYKAAMANGVSVVVKRLRDMNKLSKDAFDIEVRRLGRIRHQNILSPLAYHFRKEEKLLVSEYIPKGSLLFLLHGDRGIHHAELNWPTRLKIVKGVARGMGFLHTEFASYELPHGNLKSSNILLSSNYEPLLMDYALYPLISNTQSVQALFAYKSPEAILYQKLSPKSDVYCLGIVILETITGKFPSQYLNNQKGGTDVVQWIRQAISEKRVSELIDPEIASASKSSLGQMEKLLHIGAACTESKYDKRIEMKEAIRSIEETQEV